MFRKIIFSIVICFFSFSSIGYTHSGRTDSSGGHNCSAKSVAKGLCSGYHNHNSGNSSESSSTSTNSSSTDKNCSDFRNYDEVIQYWNAQGYSATYDPENLDGWGNNVVDDGIPCEAPNDYDLSKVNNSTHQQDAIDEDLGNKAGEDAGYKSGYQNATKNTETTGSTAFKLAFTNSYNSSYLQGQNQLNEQKQHAFDDGYTLGKSSGEMVVPINFKEHTLLNNAFEEGFQKGTEEYIAEQKEHYRSLGLQDGKNDTYKQPNISEPVYIDAYNEGFQNSQNLLQEDYTKLGYTAAFSTINYEDPKLENEKFTSWYKEGFESNKIIKEIEEYAISMGKNGEDLVIPSEYEEGENVFTHYYNKGREEYINPTPFIASGVGVAATSALGYFIFKRTRKKKEKV